VTYTDDHLPVHRYPAAYDVKPAGLYLVPDARIPSIHVSNYESCDGGRVSRGSEWWFPVTRTGEPAGPTAYSHWHCIRGGDVAVAVLAEELRHASKANAEAGEIVGMNVQMTAESSNPLLRPTHAQLSWNERVTKRFSQLIGTFLPFVDSGPVAGWLASTVRPRPSEAYVGNEERKLDQWAKSVLESLRTHANRVAESLPAGTAFTRTLVGFYRHPKG
jgi:hypothetical protein